MEKLKYKNPLLDLDFYPELFNNEQSNYIYNELVKILKRDFPEKMDINNDINDLKRRTSFTYGISGLIYEIHWYGKVTKREAKDWANADIILKIRDIVSELTHNEYTICCVMVYPNGKCGINPHRDREMKDGTTICGVSFGENRTLLVSRGQDKIKLDLKSGSCYVFNPPTNDYYTHSIPKDNSNKPRISLTFRNY